MMGQHKWVIIGVASCMFVLVVSFYHVAKTCGRKTPVAIHNVTSLISFSSEIQSLNNGKWIKCFRAVDGTIFMSNHLKSSDAGISARPQHDIDVEEITINAAGAVLSKDGIFYAVAAESRFVKPGIYTIKAWRSTDELRTLHVEEAMLSVPEGPERARGEGEFYGIGVYRNILEMRDGSWLMTMYGNFRQDQFPPQGNDARQETKFMMRTFIVKSIDEGKTWNYLASVAVPKPGDPVGEGFVEPTATLLKDGRLLCVMRTGHHFPLYASWSSDGGKSWTAPVYTGLDRGCAPCLITLADGRVALSWGRRFPEGWSRIDGTGDATRFKYPGQGIVFLSISDDGGSTWHSSPVARNVGSCYSTIMEVGNGVIFFQVDQWIWRVTLNLGSERGRT